MKPIGEQKTGAGIPFAPVRFGRMLTDRRQRIKKAENLHTNLLSANKAIQAGQYEDLTIVPYRKADAGPFD